MKQLPTLPANTVYWMMEKTCETFGDRVAQMYKPDGENYVNRTYLESNDIVKALATGLIDLGVKKGDKVGLIADNSDRWMWVSMGITNIGAVDVPRGTDATLDDLKYILKHAGCKYVFFDGAEAFKKMKPALKQLKNIKHIIFFDKPGRVSAPGVKFHVLGDLIDKGQKRIAKEGDKAYHKRGKAVKPHDLLTIVYTSGTTGASKGVMLTHENLVFNVDQSQIGVPIYDDDSSIALLPPWHIAERLVESLSIRSGASIGFTSVPTLAADLQVIKPTNFGSVPRVWEAFYNKIQEGVKKASPVKRGLFNFFSSVAMNFSEQKDILLGHDLRVKNPFIGARLAKKAFAGIALPVLFIPNVLAQAGMRKVHQAFGGKVRYCGSGAGALPPHIDRFFKSIGLPINEVYGMTETAGIATRREVGREVIGTVGIPSPDMEVRLVDEQGRVVTEPGVKGVCQHRGKHIMVGYYKDKKKTNEVLKDGWLDSGDIMMWTANGDLKFAGRAKHTIVLMGGENLEPEPIENVLIQSPFVDQVIITGQDKKSITCLIVPAFEIVMKHMEIEGKTVPEEPGGKVDWNQNKEVMQLFRHEIRERVSDKNGFKNFERITNFTLIMNPFAIGDELTQTMKMRRNVIFDKYAKQIEAMYH